MDKYRKVPQKQESAPKTDDEIRITAMGSVSAYVAYAAKLYNEMDKQQVVINATGTALTKAVTLAEVIKRRFKGLHQVTTLSSAEIIDEYEPLEEGLDKVTNTRVVPCMKITLSKVALDTSDIGYQAPIEESLVMEYDPEKTGRGWGSGRGSYKGKGRGKSMGKGDGKGKGKGKGKGYYSYGDEPSKGKGKKGGKGWDEPSKGKDKGKGKGKAYEDYYDPPKGKGKMSKDSYKGKSGGKGKKAKYDDYYYDYYQVSKGPKGGGKYGGKNDYYDQGKYGMKSHSKGYDYYGGGGDYDYYGGKSKGKGKSRKGDKGWGY